MPARRLLADLVLPVGALLAAAAHVHLARACDVGYDFGEYKGVPDATELKVSTGSPSPFVFCGALLVPRVNPGSRHRCGKEQLKSGLWSMAGVKGTGFCP